MVVTTILGAGLIALGQYIHNQDIVIPVDMENTWVEEQQLAPSEPIQELEEFVSNADVIESTQDDVVEESEINNEEASDTPEVVETPEITESESEIVVDTPVYDTDEDMVDTTNLITPEDLLITEDNNTRDHIYIPNQISYNNTEFRLSAEDEKVILDAIKRTGKRVSFYVTDPETNASISYNAEQKMEPASSIKAGMVLLACKMVDTGQLSLDTEYVYTDSMYRGGSGSIQFDAYGTKYTLRELIHRTINISDNIAYDMIRDLAVGRDNYNQFVTDLGCDNTLASWERMGYMSSKDLNLIWQEIGASDREKGEELYRLKKQGIEVDESNYSACAIFNYELLDAQYNFLQRTMPNCKSHKSGFSYDKYADSGRLYFDDFDLIVTIMTSGGTTGAEKYNFDLVGTALNECLISEYVSYKENLIIDQTNEEIEMAE